jgi:hypothetical protein
MLVIVTAGVESAAVAVGARPASTTVIPIKIVVNARRLDAPQRPVPVQVHTLVAMISSL